MAAVTRNDLNAGVLQTWLQRKALTTFEPELHFIQLGQEDVKSPAGYNTYSWAKFSKVATSSVTTGSTSDDGVSPSDTAFNATVLSVSPTQYRIVISLSDLVVENNVINFIGGASEQVGRALARKIDQVIQTTIMAGTNVIYAGGKTARSSLTASDTLTAVLFNQASAFLMSKDAPTFDGFYVAVIHPAQLRDLREGTGTGNWLEVNKYVSNDRVLKGEIGMLNGVRIVVSSHVQPFSSTTTVYPALVVGKEAYGIAGWQNLKVYYVPATPSDSDPLAQRHKVGGKVTLGCRILQEDSMVRIETGATAL